jgi:hypothetical protein
MEPIDSENYNNVFQSTKLNKVPLIVSMIIIVIGWILHLLHWPLADVSMLLGLGVFFGYNISAFLSLKGTNNLNNLLSISALIWIFILFIGVFFLEGHPFNLDGVILYFVVMIITIVINQIKFDLKKKG